MGNRCYMSQQNIIRLLLKKIALRLTQRWLTIVSMGLCLLLSTSLIHQSWASDYFYRYKDDSGTIVINQSIPPQYIKNGYSILKKTGIVLKVVPPAISDEEKEARNRIARQEKEEQKRHQIQAASDNTLLRTFSRPEDAQRARDRKLAALDVLIDITKGNMHRLRMQYDSHERKAAALERSGSAVPEKIMNNLAELNRQIKEAEQFIKDKKEEKTKVTSTYAGYIKRLSELTQP
jgi:hypothetical protein